MVIKKYNTQINETAFFTICSNNYISMAKVWLKSAKKFYSNVDFFIILADAMIHQSYFYPEDCEIIEAKQIGIENFNHFAFRYDILEFNTAIKPSAILFLMNQNYKNVLYFDPDIKIFNTLDKVFENLNQYQIILTPHLTKPLNFDNTPNDFTIMRAGVYNLGFIAVSEGNSSRSILNWWRHHLQYHCINDINNGIFVDQKFMDLTPGFSDQVFILKDSTYNVAYWNLHQRNLQVKDNSYFVDNQALSFFHFSGFDKKNPKKLTKYSSSYQDNELSIELQQLINEYIEELNSYQHGSTPAGVYSYGKFSSGTPIPFVVRELFRSEFIDWPDSLSPFETFEDYLHLPSVEWSCLPDGYLVSNLLAFIHKKNEWLRNFMPIGQAQSASHLARWYIENSLHIVKDRRLIEPTAVQFGPVTAAIELKSKTSVKRNADVAVIGYHESAMGLGEIAHQVLKTLHLSGIQAVGVPVTLNTLSDQIKSPMSDLLVNQVNASVQIFVINADQFLEVLSYLKSSINQDAYRIIIPFWELEKFPDQWMPAFEHVDEVWAATQFIQSMLKPKLNIPVLRMPIAIDFETTRIPNRQKFKIKQDAFVFYFSFDYLSYSERKNPTAVVKAFEILIEKEKKSPSSRKVQLIIKSMNKNKVQQSNMLLNQLLSKPSLQGLIIEIDETLSRDDTLSLMSSCDAVISLHRSEGLGLLIPQAMMLGLPVIATDYSATTELVNPSTAWPVDFQLIQLKNGDYPFWENQYWADPDISHASWQMQEVMTRKEEVIKRKQNAIQKILSTFNTNNSQIKMINRLKQIGILK